VRRAGFAYNIEESRSFIASYNGVENAGRKQTMHAKYRKTRALEKV
jgi:hypothetical protein